MTLDRPTKAPNGRSSTNTSAQKWTGKSPQMPSTARFTTSTPSPTLRKDGYVCGMNATALDLKEDVATPVKTLLSSNITPRSGSRKARIESASSTPRRTPEGTPPAGRPLSMIEGRDWPSGGPKLGTGLGERGGRVSRPERARSVTSDVQHSIRGGITTSSRENGSRTASPDTLSKFFHANEAKPRHNPRTQTPSPRLQPQRPGTQYTDGMSNIGRPTVCTSPDGGDDRPKFFYANGNQETGPPRLTNGAFSARPPLQTIFSSYQSTTSPAQRPPSPLKEEVLPGSRKPSLSKLSPRRHTRLVSSGSNDIRAPDMLVKGESDLSRRSSLHKSTWGISQSQSPVATGFNFASSRRSSIALSDSGREHVPSPGSQSAELPPTEPTITTSPQPDPSQSPSRPAPGQSKLDHLNELAADARRERKVLDLEISNSSLLAINRTLETEMRKQKAELRYLRRLRSSGRFPSSTRSASSRFSIPSAAEDLSPTSSADEDGIDDDRFSNLSGTSDDTSFPDSLSFSPTPRNSSMAAAKGRQIRAFKLDLSAQRVLLLDSQKLNQALKRCLGRTDELIADGRKALNYKVDTGKMLNLGPRVLTPDEHDEELEMGRGLLSPGLDEKIDNPWERPRSVGDTWNVPQLDGSREDILDVAAHDEVDRGDHTVDAQSPDMLGISYDKPGKEPDPEIPEVLEEVLEGKPHRMADDFHEPPGTGFETKEPAPEDVSPVLPHNTGLETQDTLDIPYEDPGIDTGGETSALEDDEEESTEAEEELQNLSPGKGLGVFLRMVGGSWGV
ncbi:MAG: hypothetical protein Q9181_003367 [Wetmoreana brouardii]